MKVLRQKVDAVRVSMTESAEAVRASVIKHTPDNNTRHKFLALIDAELVAALAELEEHAYGEV